MRRAARVVLYAGSVIYSGVCVYMTHAPVPQVVERVGNDKFKHVVGYAGLAGSLYLCTWARGVRRELAMVGVPVAVMIWGTLDEVTQPPFGRTADFKDWLADVAGTFLAVGTLALVRALSSKREGAEIRSTKSE